MRLTVGEITIEAETAEQVEFLVKQIAAIRSAQPLPFRSVPSVIPLPLKTEGIIHRTQDEKERGLTIEQAREERRAKNEAAGLTGLLAVVREEDKGATFQQDGEELDLGEVPTDD